MICWNQLMHSSHGCAKAANPRVWGTPFQAEMEWKWRFEVCLYVLTYIYFSYHNTIYRPCADTTAQFYSTLCKSQLSSQDTGAWTRWKRDRLTTVWVGNREKPVWAQICYSQQTGGGSHGAHHDSSPWESWAVRQGLAPLDMAAKGTLLGKKGDGY